MTTPEDGPLYLTSDTEDGGQHTVTVPPPGRGLRLAVGSLHERSSVWRVTARRNDVYIAAAGLGQSMKLSLHESGIWRQAYLSRHHAEAAGAAGRAEFNNDPRVLDRWEEPEGDSGWMHAFTVWVPHGQLTPLPGEVENPKKPITWLPRPDLGCETGLHFVIVRPDEGVIALTDMRIVDGFRLPNQRALIALVSQRLLEPTRAQWLQDMSLAALVMAQGESIEHFGDPLRLGLFSRDNNGNRSVHDLRAPAQDVLERANKTGLTVSTTYQAPLKEPIEQHR